MKRSIQNIFGEHSDLLIGTVLAMFVRALSALSSFILSIVIARKLGASESGLFFLSLSIVTVVATLSRFGLDNPLVKTIAANIVNQRQNNYSIRPITLAASKFVIFVSVLVAVVIMLTSRLISEFFDKPELQDPLWVMAMVIVPMACANIYSSIQLGLKKTLLSTLSATCLVPVLSLAIIVLGIIPHTLNWDVSLQAISWIYFFASCLAALVAFYWCFAQFKNGDGSVVFEMKSIAKLGMPFYPIVIFQLLITWPAIWSVGYFCSASDVALYSTAHKTSQLLALFLVSVNSIAAPKFSMLYSEGKTIELERVAKLSAIIAAASAIPIMIFYWIFSREIMGLFGNEFKSAAVLLKILTVGQLVNAVTGPTAYILLMTGNEDSVRKSTFIGGCVCVFLSVILVYYYGVIGGAFSAAISMSLINFMTCWYVYQRLNIITLPFVKGNFSIYTRIAK